MGKFKLSKKAVDDLSSIWDYTFNEWSELQADKFFCCESSRCMSHCPKKAIETAHGSIIGYSMVFSLVILVMFYQYFALWFFPIEHGFVRWMIASLLYIALLAVWYRAPKDKIRK